MQLERDLRRKVATQHGLIDSLLRGLHGAVASGDAARAKGRLASLRRAVEAHFTLEENHYYPAARADRPELEAEIERLVDEHARLRADLARIGAELDAAAFDTAASALAAFDATLHRHEDLEHELMGD